MFVDNFCTLSGNGSLVLRLRYEVDWMGVIFQGFFGSVGFLDR